MKHAIVILTLLAILMPAIGCAKPKQTKTIRTDIETREESPRMIVQ